MNRFLLQDLANERIKDAEALLGLGRWSGAYYLAGYAVECALKACVARLTREFDFPASRNNEAFTHDFQVLLKCANLTYFKEQSCRQNSKLELYWRRVGDWREDARYNIKTESEARELYEAVSDPDEGVLQWISSHW